MVERPLVGDHYVHAGRVGPSVCDRGFRLADIEGDCRHTVGQQIHQQVAEPWWEDSFGCFGEVLRLPPSEARDAAGFVRTQPRWGWAEMGDRVHQPPLVYVDSPAVVLVRVIASPNRTPRRKVDQAGFLICLASRGFLQRFARFDATADGIPTLEPRPRSLAWMRSNRSSSSSSRSFTASLATAQR